MIGGKERTSLSFLQSYDICLLLSHRKILSEQMSLKKERKYNLLIAGATAAMR